MKKGSIILLKVVILLIAAGALVWMIWFPQLEGRARNLDLLSIYADSFIIYGYIASIPFFLGLYQVFKLLNFIERNKTSSKDAINALRNIKLCALTLIGFIVLGELYLRFFAHGDDIAGPTALGICAVFVVAVIATTSAVFQKRLQKGKSKKS